MALSSTFDSGTIDQGAQEVEYPYPSKVNAASFVSIKLSGKANYVDWEEQMLSLLKSHDMLGFIDGKLKNPVQNRNGGSKKVSDMTVTEKDLYKRWQRSDTLVKKWIRGSLCEDVKATVISSRTASDVWRKLSNTYAKKDQAEYLPLYRATLKGEWEKVQEILKMDEDALNYKLNDDEESPLHVAIGTCEHIHFVEKLLEKITPKSLPTLVTKRKANPLHHAAFVGNTAAAKMLVKRNPSLLFLPDSGNCLPILRAIYGSHVRTFLYLLKSTKTYITSYGEGHQNPFKGKNGCTLLKRVISVGLWDVAYGLIKEYPEIATIKDGDSTPLKSIAGKLDGYFSGKPHSFYQRSVNSYVPPDSRDLKEELVSVVIEDQEIVKREIVDKHTRSFFHRLPRIKKLQEEKVQHNKALLVLKSICEEVSKLNSIDEMREHYLDAITMAVKHDSREAVEQIIGYFPQAISTKENEYPLIHLAIINRCERVYNLLVHQAMSNNHSHKIYYDKNRNNLLHLAGELSPVHKLNLVTGAALQMQRELQWFEEVKNIALPWHEKSNNYDQESPIMVFRRAHTELRKEGEEWMKKTADSYTITAALIVTIVFAAAITVPGGTDGDNGKAIYATKPSFIIFAVSDAISLFTSTTSLLLFLSILTARYAEEDFLHKLPKRLIFGLAMLFLSVTSMMVAFSATLYLMFGRGKAWIVIPIAILTCLPIASFVTLQLPLLFDLISSTYGRGIFDKHSDKRNKQS